MKRLGFVLSLLGLASLVANPVLAGPVEMKQVRQILKGNYQQGGADTAIDLRLVAGEGDDKKKAAGATTDPNANPQDPKPPAQPQEEVQEEVTVESCDCPQPPPIPVTKGGFPKWIFGLGAIPLICLTGICSSDDTPPSTPPPDTPPGPTPTPTDTPPVPEPASILLLGSGLIALGAAARRFRQKFGADMLEEGE